jgi:hypothetical protein
MLVLLVSLVLTLGAAGAAMGFVPYSDADRPGPAAADEPASDRVDLALPIGHELASQPIGGDVDKADRTEAPADSGEGRRVVYDMSAQRVWLVRANDSVQRSYLVSGSVLDNLRPGAYDVYSRSRHAVGYDQQSTMDYMVRFTEGDNAAIGFHDIPEDLAGQPVQSVDQLGSAQSHGCIRQRPADAREMWRFATIGTPVRVLA